VNGVDAPLRVLEARDIPTDMFVFVAAPALQRLSLANLIGIGEAARVLIEALIGLNNEPRPLSAIIILANDAILIRNFMFTTSFHIVNLTITKKPTNYQT